MFCRFCGNPVHEQAYMCPSCGSQLKAFSDELFVEAEELRLPSRKFYLLTKIFSIIATVLSARTLLCGVWAIFMILAGVAIGNEGGLLLVLYSLFGIVAMIGFAPFALTTGILAFAFRKKSLQPTGGFPVFAFVFGIVAFVIGIGSYLLAVIQ